MNAVLTYIAKKQFLKETDRRLVYVYVWSNSLGNICDALHHCLPSFKSNALTFIFHTVYQGSFCGFTSAQNLTIKVSVVAADLSAVFKPKIYASFPVKTCNYMGW